MIILFSNIVALVQVEQKEVRRGQRVEKKDRKKSRGGVSTDEEGIVYRKRLINIIILMAK